MFFICTIGSIVCLIIYLWVFKEIDESLLAIEIQNTTARELKNEIDTIKNKVEKLSRSDLITARAKRELRMVTAEPETLIIAINKSSGRDIANPIRNEATKRWPGSLKRSVFQIINPSIIGGKMVDKYKFTNSKAINIMYYYVQDWELSVS